MPAYMFTLSLCVMPTCAPFSSRWQTLVLPNGTLPVANSSALNMTWSTGDSGGLQTIYNMVSWQVRLAGWLCLLLAPFVPCRISSRVSVMVSANGDWVHV